ncbi:lactoylglutathione lyase [Marinobacterium nitratireducens]|uniref:Lactoylglutathione lyase n=1 Tax=Marinobacterium nitratireducens TaxID=518897 RepID=A0A918DU04_9GAMM|nr:VOC family protein [Marinobacterium nitratireducens]GGO82378.1 lactoylglutathione lyase [Marinobacterium nitratireducens]
MIHITALDHLVLRVERLEPMLAFYRDILGCTLERVKEDLGLYQLRAGSSLIDLVTLDGPLGRAGGGVPDPEARNLDHFCLRLNPFDADGIRRYLAARGVEAGPVERRYGAEGEGPSIYISDPEGNTVELKGPAEAS